MNKMFKFGAKASAALFSSAMLFSCGQGTPSLTNDPGVEYAPQMYNSIPYEPLKQEASNEFNPGGGNLRVPARNTIARGKMGFIDYSADTSTMDVMGAGLVNPLQANEATLEEGKVLYTRMCSACHGDAGAGDGLVAPKFKGVANLTSAAIKAKPMGHIYQVITHGKGRMMPHNTQVNPQERWKIALYVKNVLQGEGEATTSPGAGGSHNAGAPEQGNVSTDQNTNQVTGTEAPAPGSGESTKPVKK
ncbi:c-type cytochrome [Adhaeribacter soli]|uniref:Cytochrome c n=1 Tax=Adhaeribacter soli TaxID=2607655 RepID=A0A5N1IJP9_9BACT|nr:cytochrome c [Adhaeribacter soli]KAA9325973.1 cytochrome c [Adhaeribacter soli]